jgi:hypothetical protein
MKTFEERFLMHYDSLSKGKQVIGKEDGPWIFWGAYADTFIIYHRGLGDRGGFLFKLSDGIIYQSNPSVSRPTNDLKRVLIRIKAQRYLNEIV